MAPVESSLFGEPAFLGNGSEFDIIEFLDPEYGPNRETRLESNGFTVSTEKTPDDGRCRPSHATRLPPNTLGISHKPLSYCSLADLSQASFPEDPHLLSTIPPADSGDINYSKSSFDLPDTIHSDFGAPHTGQEVTLPDSDASEWIGSPAVQYHTPIGVLIHRRLGNGKPGTRKAAKEPFAHFPVLAPGRYSTSTPNLDSTEGFFSVLHNTVLSGAPFRSPEGTTIAKSPDPYVDFILETTRHVQPGSDAAKYGSDFNPGDAGLETGGNKASDLETNTSGARRLETRGNRATNSNGITKATRRSRKQRNIGSNLRPIARDIRSLETEENGATKLKPKFRGSTSMFPCSVTGCPTQFSRHSDVRRHVDNCHERSTEYYCRANSPCRRATRGFPRKDKRNEHERKVHKLDLPSED